MIVGDLIETLMEYSFTQEVRIEAAFRLDKPAEIKSIVIKDGTVVIRDHFLITDSSANFQSFDGEAYEVIYDK